MTFFVECTLPGRNYRSGHIENKTANLALCTSLSKSRIHWYPDNTGIPSIKFNGCNVEWAFNSDAQRDAEYQRVVALTQPDPTP